MVVVDTITSHLSQISMDIHVPAGWLLSGITLFAPREMSSLWGCRPAPQDPPRVGAPSPGLFPASVVYGTKTPIDSEPTPSGGAAGALGLPAPWPVWVAEPGRTKPRPEDLVTSGRVRRPDRDRPGAVVEEQQLSSGRSPRWELWIRSSAGWPRTQTGF